MLAKEMVLVCPSCCGDALRETGLPQFAAKLFCAMPASTTLPPSAPAPNPGMPYTGRMVAALPPLVLRSLPAFFTMFRSAFVSAILPP